VEGFRDFAEKCRTDFASIVDKKDSQAAVVSRDAQSPPSP
jgi:hypothetical protein